MFRETRDMLLEDAAALQRLIHQAEIELRKAKKRENIERGKKALDSVHEHLESRAWQVKVGHTGEIGEGTEGGSIYPGDRVQLVDKKLEGTVLSLIEKNRQLEVQVGNTRLKVGIEDVERVKVSDGEVPPEFPLIRKSPGKRAKSLELDLRGRRADEVPGILDGYLNDAFLANFGRVCIIHGYATGTVRQVVREILASHPLVKAFQPGEKGEGGDGVTIVQL